MISSAHLLFLIRIVILVLLGNALYYTLGVGSGSGRQVSLLHVRIEDGDRVSSVLSDQELLSVCSSLTMAYPPVRPRSDNPRALASKLCLYRLSNHEISFYTTLICGALPQNKILRE